GSAVGAAVTGRRPLEHFERAPLIGAGAILLLVAAVGFWQPQVITWPIGIVLALLGLHLVSRGIHAWLEGRPRPPDSAFGSEPLFHLGALSCGVSKVHPT